MSNFELPGQTPNFDIFWQQWLARQANVLTLDSDQELSNKTFDLSLNTLTGTTAQFNAALSDSNFLTDASIGSTVQAWDSGLDALAAFNTNGILVQTANNTFAGRTLTGTANEIDVTNGSGVSGNPVISLPTSLDFTGKTITNATLVDPTLSGTVAGSPTASGDWTFTGTTPITISHATASRLRFLRTGSSTNNKAWDATVSSTTMTWRTLDDNFSAGNQWLKVTRNGVVVQSIELGFSGNATVFQVDGEDVLTEVSVDTVSNKSISLASNTITGTKTQFNTALTDGNFLFTDLIGSTVQAWDADLDAIAALTSAADKVPYSTGAQAWAMADFTAGGRALVNSAGTADTFPYFSASNTVTLASITAAGLALLDDADASAQRTTLGLGTIATQAANSVNIDGGTIDDVTLGGTLAGSPSASGSWVWTSSSASYEPIRLVSTNADAASGPLFTLYRDSASPAAGDVLGAHRFLGRNSAGTEQTYASFRVVLDDATDGSEDSSFQIFTQIASTVAQRLSIGAGLYMVGATGGDQGAGTINATAVYDDGVLLT